MCSGVGKANFFRELQSLLQLGLDGISVCISRTVLEGFARQNMTLGCGPVETGRARFLRPSYSRHWR